MRSKENDAVCDLTGMCQVVTDANRQAGTLKNPDMSTDGAVFWLFSGIIPLSSFSPKSSPPPMNNFLLPPLQFEDFFSQYFLPQVEPVGQGVHGPTFLCCPSQEPFNSCVVKIARYSPTSEHALQLHGQALQLGEIIDIKAIFINMLSSGSPFLALNPKLSEGQHFLIVLPYKEGGDLLMRFFRGPIPNSEVVYIFRQVVRAVAQLHALDIAHGDLKLENVVREENAAQTRVFLIDFDFAHSFTETAICPGTWLYTSPEMIYNLLQKERGEASVAPGGEAPVAPGGAADVWALGVMLYIMLTRKSPFPLDNAIPNENGGLPCLHFITSVLEGAFNKRHLAALPSLAQDLVEGMLNPHPERRLTARQVLDHEFLADSDAPMLLMYSI